MKKIWTSFIWLPYLSGKSNLFLKGSELWIHEDDYYREDWFHDSPLPPAFDRAKFLLKYPKICRAITKGEKEFCLQSLENTYWINLAVPMDDPFLGINGAAYNLGGMSNFGRFMNKKTFVTCYGNRSWQFQRYGK